MSQFLWGAFGAFAVEFVRIWRLRDGEFVRPRTYYVLGLGMVVVAGAWALAIAKDDVPLAQITSGASAPAAISVLATTSGLGRREEGQRRQRDTEDDATSDEPPDGETRLLATDKPPPSVSFANEVARFFAALGPRQ